MLAQRAAHEPRRARVRRTHRRGRARLQRLKPCAPMLLAKTLLPLGWSFSILAEMQVSTAPDLGRGRREWEKNEERARMRRD